MMTVLAIDNNRAELDQLCIYLEAVLPESEIISYVDPLPAMQYMTAHSKGIEIVFTALLMQPMDGFYLFDVMHRLIPGCLAVAVNQTETWEFKQLAYQRGANAILLKPITAAAVCGALRECGFPC